ncbi:response regulator receiver and ANTAR domain protein [Kribbella amoyensis]|uniref:histidine kinase n=1 Tax=Kribbella amoyensis TaxID=996641 RepID=A0A561BTD3_9ACTN|nr:ATP-binding protein [Kribbella amoyensis]TWD82154.1 response regulator receiver and ANTAR domain protein [Kribbella amoyensis]
MSVTAEELFRGTGTTRKLLREHAWESTPLGPVDQWPPELLAAVRTVLASEVPMLIWWGPDLLQLYNDAYTPVLGSKHPASMGQAAAVCWAEAWPELRPMAMQVLSGAGATYSVEQFLLLNRHGYREETYWTFSYSPITDAENAVRGVFVATTDVSAAVVGRRRLVTLNQLGGLSAAGTTVLAAARSALDVLGDNRADVPFAVLYDERPDQGEPVTAYGVTGSPADQPGLREVVERVRSTAVAEHVTGLPPNGITPSFVGPGTPSEALVTPLTGPSGPLGVLVLGISPHRAFDREYRNFLDVVARQVTTTLTDAWAYQAERRRAQSLADLDAAKTRFFQNISHEFRTPLTLLLGPLKELSSGEPLPAGKQHQVETARRAAVRLRQLVDGLLDISLADAGQLRAQPEPTDVAELTVETTSMFRSAAERHGLELTVAVPDRPVVALVDREMWVKVLSNLLSNAVKYTPSGRIDVTLTTTADEVVCAVTDTGIGIAAADTEHVFERFHRSDDPTARSAEGAGIGLPLATELVRLHGGTIAVASEPGKGSTFTVRMPVTAEKLAPPAPLESVRALTEAHLNAAGPTKQLSEATTTPPRVELGRLLLVEDNTDMREYLVRLLSTDGWTVDAVGDVDSALTVREPPDLVLSDIMLPGRDGIALLQTIRAYPPLARTPVVLLTARAGASAAVDGLTAGADDYIVKPFDAAELLARLRVHHELHQLREHVLSTSAQESAELRKALASNRRIGTALGVLMTRLHLTEAQAFDVLSAASQRSNRKLRDLADEIILTGDLPADRADYVGSEGTRVSIR